MVRRVEIDLVTTPNRSALACDGRPGVTPVVLVHGIMDSVCRWVDSVQLCQSETELKDLSPPPLFDVEKTVKTPIGGFSARWRGPGLLNALAGAGVPAVAFTYQGGTCLVASMCDAVAALHRVIDWSRETWGASAVDLVGHSRGGLVIRHALLTDTEVMTANEARRAVRSVVSLCSPFRGSSLAEVAGPFVAAIESFERVICGIGGSAVAKSLQKMNDMNPLRTFLLNIGQLKPNADEVRFCASENCPPIGGGYFALAGTEPCYFRYEFPGVGRIALPPSLPIAELQPGVGDMAVAVPSALDIPDFTPSRLRTVPVNHLHAPFDPRVQQQVLRWLQA